MQALRLIRHPLEGTPAGVRRLVCIATGHHRPAAVVVSYRDDHAETAVRCARCGGR